MDATDILKFWFEELSPKDWFSADPGLDDRIRERFSPLLESARRAELFRWRVNGIGRLAEILVLDQFSRNVYRGTPAAFSADPLALALAQEAVALRCEQDWDPARRAFLYMPFMHSESLIIHEVALQLFSAPGLENNLDFEKRHKAILDRFGRYPHRNRILARSSTPEEEEFLRQPGSSF